MTDSTDQSFDVYFAGECAPGKDIDEVRAALGKLFKADGASLERLFSGERQIIKRGCDQATALTYQRAMKKAGAVPVITRSTQSGKKTSTESSADSGTAQAAEPANTLSLAPAGSDVLAPEERSAPVSSTVNTDHLSASPIGERMIPAQPEPPRAAVPDFALAEVGAELGADSPRAPATSLPNTDGISLTAGEYDLSDCARRAPDTGPLELDHLHLAESGADLLTEEQRRREPVTAPDTSHLHLSDGSDRD